MTEVMEQAKKKLDDVLFTPISWTKGIRGGDYPNEEVYISGTSRDELIKAILSIPELLIKDPDQSLPIRDIDIHIWRDYSPDIAYEKSQLDMRDDNWMKVLPKEAK